MSKSSAATPSSALYRATAQSVEIHVRGSDPERGTGVDRRLLVEM